MLSVPVHPLQPPAAVPAAAVSSSAAGRTASARMTGRTACASITLILVTGPTIAAHYVAGQETARQLMARLTKRHRLTDIFVRRGQWTVYWYLSWVQCNCAFILAANCLTFLLILIILHIDLEC
jgi:hypothetical protein